MSLKKMAVELAKPMIAHSLAHGATKLDSDFIADESCEIAYKIHEKIKAYDGDDEMSEKDIKRLISEAIKKSQPVVSLSHNPH